MRMAGFFSKALAIAILERMRKIIIVNSPVCYSNMTSVFNGQVDCVLKNKVAVTILLIIIKYYRLSHDVVT